jgi:FkbM family methyltransferase
MEGVLKLSAPDKIWIDVGAHQGEKTMSAARDHPDLRVYAFEPNLRVAAPLFGKLPNFVVIPMAVAETNGAAEFHVNRFAAASSLLPFNPDGWARWKGRELLEVDQTVTVPTIRLDTFLDLLAIPGIDYLKIDAQGADLAVIRSLGSRIHDVRRLCLEVQVNPLPLYRGGSRKDEVLHFLLASGFTLCSVETQSHGQEENLEFVRNGSPGRGREP